jgi:membrane protein YfhO
LTPTGPIPDASRSHRDLPWIAGLLALLFVQWASFLLTSKTFYFRDLSFFFAPLIAETAHQWGAGVFPAWNPHLACGAPLAADPNAGAFFPDILVATLLGGSLFAVKFLLLVRLFLLPLAAYVALRLARLPPAAAGLGAALISLSGPVATSLSSFPPTLAGAIFLLPLAACGWRLVSEGKKGVAVSAMLLALTLFAGSPELALQGGIAFTACALCRPLLRSISSIALSAAAGALIAAPLWLPGAALYARTPRGLGRALATPPGFLSFPPVRLLELLWPGLLGDPGSPEFGVYWGRGLTGGVTPFLLSIAVGLLPLILLPASLRHPLGRRLAAVAGVFVLLSFGRYLPFGEALVRSPFFRPLRYPEKWWIGASLGLAALAGIGWQELRRDGFRRVRGPVIAALVATGLSLTLGIGVWLQPKPIAAALRAAGLVEGSIPVGLDNRIIRTMAREAITALLVSLAILIFLSSVRRFSRAGWVAAALAMLAVAERLSRVAGSVPAVPIEELRAESPPVVAARQNSKDGRFFYDREATTLLDPLRPFTGILHGLSYAGNTDIDQFSDARSRDFAETLHALSFADDRKPALLRLAGVRVVDTNDPAAVRNTALSAIAAAGSDRVLYRLSGGLSARLFYQAVRADSAATAIRYLRAENFPTETIAVVEQGEAFRGEPSPHRLSDIEDPRPEEFRVEVNTEAPALLQVSVSYDPNWRVSIDGRPARAFPVDAAFLGVMVPAGRHEVTGQYRESLFIAGALVAVTTLAGLGVWMRRAGRGIPDRSASPRENRIEP